MLIRSPAVAGSFYPFGSNDLENMIKKFLDAKVDEADVLGLVCPHAGYQFSGKTAGYVYRAIKNKFDTAVILGPNHSGVGDGIATSTGIWKTPFGSVSIDEEFVQELVKSPPVTVDPRAHLHEHSIEVQLPFLQHRFKDFNLVPIAISSLYYNKDSCKKVGERIAEVAKKLNRKILVIASSDFTHYGRMYRYTPFSGSTSQILKKVKETDAEIISYIERLMPERILEVCNEKDLSICGYGGISAMLWAVNKLGAKKGKLLNYSTSFDVSRDINAVVGYAGIAIF